MWHSLKVSKFKSNDRIQKQKKVSMKITELMIQPQSLLPYTLLYDREIFSNVKKNAH